MPQKTWVVGEEVLAADFNAYVQEQVVATFPTAAARTTAVPSPKPGMLTYLTDSGRLELYSGTAWRAFSSVLAYVEATGGMTGLGTTLADITGLSTGPIVIPAGRRIEIAAEVMFNKAAPDTSQWVQLQIADVASTPAHTVARFMHCPAPGVISIAATRVITPAAGTYTWRCRGNTAIGFVNVQAGENWIRVTDLGST